MDECSQRGRAGRRGAENRARVLEVAIEIATAEGLEAIAIGHLSAALGLSKATVVAQFGSKEQLQLATLEAARAGYLEMVVARAMLVPEGARRVIALVEGFIDHANPECGGCFFASVAAEFDGRHGTVRDRVAALVREWLAILSQAIEQAADIGHLRPVEGDDLALELHGVTLAGNLALELLDDARAPDRAKETARQLLNRVSTKEGRASIAVARSWFRG